MRARRIDATVQSNTKKVQAIRCIHGINWDEAPALLPASGANPWASSGEQFKIPMLFDFPDEVSSLRIPDSIN